MLRNLFPCLIISLFSIVMKAQNESVYEIKFNSLKEYKDQAPVDLLKHLDSIFITNELITIEVGENSNVFDYKKYFIKYNHNLNDSIKANFSIDDSEELFLFLNPKDVYFSDPNWAYKIQIKNIDKISKFPRVKSFFDYTKDENEYYIRNFLIDENCRERYRDLHLKNCIIKEGVSAKYYENSIIRESRYNSNETFENYNKLFSDLSNDSDVDNSELNIEDGLLRLPDDYENQLKIKNSFIDFLGMPGSASDLNVVEISNSLIDTLVINNCSIDKFYVDYSDITESFIDLEEGEFFNGKSFKSNVLYIEKSNFKNFKIGNHWSNVLLREIKDNSEIEFNKLQDTLVILNTGNTKITLRQEFREDGKKSNIFLWNIDYDKLDTQWLGYKLFRPHDSWSDDHLNSTYLNLLGHFKKKGYEKSYEEIDKQYQEWKHLIKGETFLNWLDKIWWNYGYDKFLIIKNTLLIFLLFSFINVFFLNKLSKSLYINEKIYYLTNSNRSEKLIKRFLLNFPASLFYTSQIFFGVKFNYEKLQYADKLWGIRIFGLMYFFAIYFIGLICIGYLINVVVTI